MARIEKVKGLSTVLKNLEKVAKDKGKQLEVGLVRAGLFLQRQSQRVVPVDTGALKNSAFTRKEGKGLNTKVRVGYTVHYAVYVHENLAARHNPGKIAKFLELPAKQYKEQIFRIIRDALKGKKK